MSPRATYAFMAFGLFGIEVLIALFVRDGIVRPYIGDILAVILIYCALRAATPLKLASALVVTLAVAVAIELSQALDLLGKLGLGGNQIARLVLGGAFDVLDLAAYTAGALLVLLGEAMQGKRSG